jgi:hypothetical protein
MTVAVEIKDKAGFKKIYVCTIRGRNIPKKRPTTKSPYVSLRSAFLIRQPYVPGSKRAMAQIGSMILWFPDEKYVGRKIRLKVEFV